MNSPMPSCHASLRPVVLQITAVLAMVSLAASETSAATEAQMSRANHGGLPAAACASQERLQSALVADACNQVPSLTDSTATPDDQVSDLREWVESWVPIADTTEEGDSRGLTPPDLPRYWDLSPDDLYETLRTNQGAVLCGGAAWTLMLVYEAFGFPSWIYNTGLTSTYSHVVTLVKTGDVIQVQDPLYRYRVRDKNGRPADVRWLLRRLQSVGPDEVVSMDESKRSTGKRVFRRDAFVSAPGGGLIAHQDVGSSIRTLRVGSRPPATSNCRMHGATTVICTLPGGRPAELPRERNGALAAAFSSAGYALHPASQLRVPIGVSSAAEGWRDQIDDSENGRLLHSIFERRGPGLFSAMSSQSAAFSRFVRRNGGLKKGLAPEAVLAPKPPFPFGTSQFI